MLRQVLRRAMTSRCHVRYFNGTALSVNGGVMRDIQLSKEDVQSYRDNGFLVIRQAFNAEQLALWQQLIDAAVKNRGSMKFHYGAEDHTNVDLDFYEQVFTQRVNLFKTEEPVRNLLTSCKATIGRIACELEGMSGVRVWHDQALYKEPWANPTSWHLDVPYWSFTSPHAISVWMALDDATYENGCLHFVPTSHKIVNDTYQKENDVREIKIGMNMHDVFKEGNYPELKHLQAVAVPMKAGDISFHNGMTVHGAGPNMTPNRRRAMTVQMMPTGCVFNGKQNVLTPEEFGSLKLGESMDDEKRNPLLFQTK
eukprot:TRINITY_DN67134_c4_g2_i1.p1 TRINITY_DN67134_c4_g2~~TRINITY_DN67134_c4_g2_i1.p1  ORF type:complete len:311 (+),score=26.31 TRINITY_DN67134_c4_g2_i1:71-1003(+)